MKVAFPDDYPVENLKGKGATFAVTVKAVKIAGESKVDDDFAKRSACRTSSSFAGSSASSMSRSSMA